MITIVGTVVVDIFVVVVMIVVLDDNVSIVVTAGTMVLYVWQNSC